MANVTRETGCSIIAMGLVEGAHRIRPHLEINRVLKNSPIGRNDDVGNLHDVVTIRPSKHAPGEGQYRYTHRDA